MSQRAVVLIAVGLLNACRGAHDDGGQRHGNGGGPAPDMALARPDPVAAEKQAPAIATATHVPKADAALDKVRPACQLSSTIDACQREAVTAQIDAGAIDVPSLRDELIAKVAALAAPLALQAANAYLADPAATKCRSIAVGVDVFAQGLLDVSSGRVTPFSTLVTAEARKKFEMYNDKAKTMKLAADYSLAGADGLRSCLAAMKQ